MKGRSIISKFTGFSFSLLMSLVVVVAAYGQHQQALIRVTDQKSNEPVAFAHVCLEGIQSGEPKYSMTGLDGLAVNTSREISKIAISYMGYTTYTDTLRPGQSLEVQLRPSMLNMDEVVVTAQYVPEKADKSIYKVAVINSRQIEQKAATNMADLLKDQSGMRVTQDPVFGTSLRMQGLSGENVKFLMDGVPMIGRMNGNFDLNQINLYNVDHVEIIEGPMSVIYGSNALAGVINIITKENKSSLLNTTANAYLESAGVYNFDGSVSFNKKKHGFSVEGGRNFFGGYSPVDTSRSQAFKPRRQFFFDGYYAFSADKFRIKIAGDYFNERIIDKGSLLSPYFETAFDNEFTTIRYSVRTDASLKLGRKHFISFLASYSTWNRIRQTFFNDLTTLTKTPVQQSWAQDTNSIHSIIVRGTFARNDPGKKLNYQAGFDVDDETGTGEKIEGNKKEIGDYAGFLSVRYDPVKSVSLQPGLRFIYNTRFKAPLVYAFSARWAILDHLAVRFSYSHGFRAPSIKELYLVFVDVNHNIVGNPDLKSETSDNLNLNLSSGKENKKTAFNADLTVFYNFIRNVILLARENSFSTAYTYQNISRFRTAGFQLGCAYALYPALKVQLGFSLTGITGSPDTEIPFEPFKWSPELTLSPSYRFIKPDLTLSIYYKYTGRSPQLGMDENKVGWQWIEAYNTLDFTAGKGFWNNRIRLSAGVKNIFNTTTIPTSGVSVGGGHGGSADGGMNIAWGRTVFVKLSFQFNQYK